MILNSIRIQRETYGPLKDSYNVQIEVREPAGTITLNLPPEASQAFVEQAKEIIHKFTVRAADQLHRELQLSEPETPAQIGN